MIENSPVNNSFIYKLDPHDNRVIMRKPNHLHARWAWYLRRDTPQEAKRALLALQGKDEGAEDDPRT